MYVAYAGAILYREDENRYNAIVIGMGIISVYPMAYQKAESNHTA